MIAPTTTTKIVRKTQKMTILVLVTGNFISFLPNTTAQICIPLL